MKILSMTATFGKLSHAELSLQPGLNIINAPNEWGKSTWCAFITAMLYGIDTKERTTAANIADKDRYAPWSGEPMSGRMELECSGKAITIERSTKGRIPMGEFRAYETGSGLPIPELTGTNCGQVLLGVEKSVFLRAGFVRLADMPVTQDEALRRRLNALVTTGDESGTGDALAKKLRDLKNKCRHNKTGLLPDAEKQRDELTQKLELHNSLQIQLDRIASTRQTLIQQQKALENHRQALAYSASREGMRRLEQATCAQQTAQQKHAQLRTRCQMLPTEEFAAGQLQQLQTLKTQQAALDAEVLPTAPTAPHVPAVFENLSPADALRRAKDDKAAFDMLSRPLSPVFLILAALFAAMGIGLMLIRWYLLIPGLVLGALMVLLYSKNKKRQALDRGTLVAQYGDLTPEQWIPLAQQYSDDAKKYETDSAAAQAISASLENRRQELRSSIHNLTQGLSLDAATKKWESVLAEHKAFSSAEKELQQADSRVADLSAAIKTVEAPAFPDSLTLSEEETAQAIQSGAAQLEQLRQQEGQHLGKKEMLGSEDALRQQLAALNTRIARLEDTYCALTVALQTLADATDALQRRFAPRIAARAQSLFAALTGGRYDRLQLTQELTLNAATAEETGMQPARRRSDGTVDQLYLCLRLAVAEELTPDAPLVLDDALARFDDTRCSAAMEILKAQAAEKQVLLFTCHSREQAYTAKQGIKI